MKAPNLLRSALAFTFLCLGHLTGVQAQTQPAPATTAPRQLSAAPAPLTPLGAPTAAPVLPPGQIDPSRLVAARSNAGSLDFKLPIRRLVGLEEPLILRNQTSIYTVFLPIPLRYKVDKCVLRLNYHNSISLISERSELVVTLNDKIVSQIRLYKDKPVGEVLIDLPVAFLKPDFNRLQFIAVHRSVDKCQDFNAPELFTYIDPDTTVVEAQMTPRPVPARLSSIRDIVDEKLWYPYPFHVCIPDGAGQEDAYLSWGSIITQGMALNVGVQPFRVTHARALRPGMDNVVIGVMNSLTPFLTATEIGAINGSFLAVKPMPNDPNHYMIIISGRNDEEVSQAALAFSLINFPLPDSQYAQVDQMALPEKPMYLRNAPLVAPGSYGFKQLGIKTATIKGFNSGSFDIPVYMPGDISPNERGNVELRLHFAYGAAFRRDSALNFFVNGQFQSAVPIRDENGAMHSNHRVYLPVSAFQPGRNLVQLTPLMVPIEKRDCELFQTENLLFTLYDDSEMVVPRMQRGAHLPSFGLLSQTAFPYTATPDGVDLSVLLAGRDPDTTNAAWTLMGKMAQISGALLHRAEITFRNTRSKRNLLVVGPVDQLPAEVMQAAPINPQEAGRMRYAVSISPTPGSAAPTAVEDFLNKLRGGAQVTVDPNLESPATVNMGMSSKLLQDSVAMQFESPFHLGYAVSVFTAPSSSALLAGMNVLQQREYWDNLSGDLAVWNVEPNSLYVTSVAPKFTYGTTTVVDRAKEGLGRQPLLFAAVVIIALIILGILARLVLSRHKQADESAGK